MADAWDAGAHAGESEWLAEVVRCAAGAHDAAGEAIEAPLSPDERDAFKRLMVIVEVGLARGYIDADGNRKEPTGEGPDSERWAE